MGGPVGLLAGAKLGGLAAIGGSILGYTGASVIREKREVRRLLLAHSQDQARTPPPAQEVSAPAPQTKRRRRKAVRVKEEPREEEEEEVGAVICPPHLQTRQWRRLHHKTDQQSILALITDLEVVQPVHTVAVVSAIPESQNYQE